MKLEDKQLLFIDLCARLPYGIYLKHPNVRYPVQLIAISNQGGQSLCRVMQPTDAYGLVENIAPSIELVKPYLRPLSSMTEEEKKEFDETLKSCNRKVFACPDKERRYKFFDAEQEDFMNKHHFDYRGLIEMGLAINANDLYDNILLKNQKLI